MRRLITLILFVILGFQVQGQINTENIDSIIQYSVTNELFEGTILIAEDGKSIYHKSFGFVDEEKILPVTNFARFEIASITKMFTAITIMQLVEEGKFKLTDNLYSLLPELEIPKSKKISVHHLLLHISGLPNENDEIYAESKSPKEFVEETIANKSKKYGQFNYANIDYVLLGLIIEKYDNITWKESLQNRILDKLEMQATGFLQKENYPENFVYTFSYDKEGLRQADPLFYIENFYAAGCMYSTAEDLLKIDQALYGDSLLSAKSKELMFKSYPEYNYSGYSVWTYKYPFIKTKPMVMERRGGILGANSVLIRMLDTNKTIIILSNNNRFNPDSFGNTKSLKEALMIETHKTSR